MNFEFSEEQKIIKSQAHKFLKNASSPEKVRIILEGAASYDQNLWQEMAKLGWMATVIPEKYGGEGFGYLELCVLAEELGQFLAPVPFSSSVYLATEALLNAGSEAQKAVYLPKLACGEIIGTVAVAENTKRPSPKNLETLVTAERLTGLKIPVPDGDIADFAIVVAKQPESGSAVSLYLVDLKHESVHREAVNTFDPTRSHARIRFAETPAELLGEPGDGWNTLQRVFDHAAVLFAFEQLGGAQMALDMAKTYALERYAFGRPIGSYQAIKHKVVDMYVLTELARSNCYYGAWALSTNAPELPLAAATARVSATEAFYQCAKENIQVHGGMGFTWEVDCHLYYRRAKLLALNLGSENHWKDLLVERLETQNVA